MVQDIFYEGKTMEITKTREIEEFLNKELKFMFPEKLPTFKSLSCTILVNETTFADKLFVAKLYTYYHTDKEPKFSIHFYKSFESAIVESIKNLALWERSFLGPQMVIKDSNGKDLEMFVNIEVLEEHYAKQICGIPNWRHLDD
jgi:hypothetical protein